jgi:diguanylate cyclase
VGSQLSVLEHSTVQEAVAASGVWRLVEEGTVLFRQGDPGDKLYFIDEGTIRLTFAEVQTKKLLGPGKFFGELALLFPGTARTGTAVAETRCILRELNQEGLAFLKRERVDLYCALLEGTCSYLVESERSLVRELQQRNQELEQALDYLRRTEEELESKEVAAQTDELTGLYNRRCLNQQLTRFMERAQKSSLGLALLAIDLDRFKEVNDTRGHAMGDQVLRAVGRYLKQSIRKTDLPCRIGGDEFVVLLRDAGEHEAQIRAEKIQKELSELRLGDGEVHVTASVGGTMYKTTEDASALLERADQNLYAAKHAGRNRTYWK